MDSQEFAIVDGSGN